MFSLIHFLTCYALWKWSLSIAFFWIIFGPIPALIYVLLPCVYSTIVKWKYRHRIQIEVLPVRVGMI